MSDFFSFYSSSVFFPCLPETPGPGPVMPALSLSLSLFTRSCPSSTTVSPSQFSKKKNPRQTMSDFFSFHSSSVLFPVCPRHQGPVQSCQPSLSLSLHAFLF